MTPRPVGPHLLEDGVGGLRVDRQREVGRQRPRCGRPGPQVQRRGIPGGRDQAECHGDGRVRPRPGRVVHADLEVGQRGLRSPRIRQYPVRLVDQVLLPEPLEGPHDALHEREVHRLVVVVEIDPPRLPVHVALPLVGVPHDRVAAVCVEPVDAVVGDGAPARDAELLLGLHLRRQAVAVPAETPLDPAPAHRPIARDHVLHVAGEQVSGVGQAVGERRAVVEDVLVGTTLPGGTSRNRGLEGAFGLPPTEDLGFDLREIGFRVDVGIPRRHSTHGARS